MNQSVSLVVSFVLCLSFHPCGFGSAAAQNNHKQARTEASGVVISAKAETRFVPFGDPLRVRVTIQNNSGGPISFTPGNLRLKHTGWRKESSWSSGIGDGEPLTLNDRSNQPAVLL